MLADVEIVVIGCIIGLVAILVTIVIIKRIDDDNGMDNGSKKNRK